MDAPDTQAQQLINAVNDALAPAAPTSYRDTTPVPAIGTAPPHPQPGRPPMSQRATDASALMLSAGVASLPIGGMTSLVLYTLGHVDPTSLAIAAAAPATLAVPVLALSQLVKRAKRTPDVHHHYAGPVDQRTVNSTNRGVWAKTRTELKG